jgi:hypothetical protein
MTKLSLKHKTSKIDIISLAKAGHTQDFYTVQKEEFSATCYVCNKCTWQSGSPSIRDKGILPLEMLHEEYDHNYSVAKASLVLSPVWLGAKVYLLPTKHTS